MPKKGKKGKKGGASAEPVNPDEAEKMAMIKKASGETPNYPPPLIETET